MNRSDTRPIFGDDASIDAIIDARLTDLLSDTPEPLICGDIAARAMRLAAAPRAAETFAPRRWTLIFNAIAAISVAAVVMLGAWTLWPMLNEAGTSRTASDTASDASSFVSQSSSTNDEIALGVAVLLAAAGAQIVFRSPAGLPRAARFA